MTRPRAHQVNDPQTNYVRFALPSTPTTPKMTLSGGDYASFLAASVSGTWDGTEEDVPAFLASAVLEPYAGVSAGDSFSISLTGVNGGNLIPVTFQSGDFVTISSASVLTAAKVAARINATLATYGVATPVASNNEGYIQLTSADSSGVTKGDSIHIALSDVAPRTPGTLTRLGFTSASAAGISAKKRGILTKSADNRGGYFPLRYDNGEAVLSQTSMLLSSFNYHTNQDCLGGQSTYGRLLRKLSGVNPYWELSFFVFGMAPPEIVGNSGDFTSITAGDVLRVQASIGSVACDFNVDLGALTINSVTDVVNGINAQWWAAGFGAATVVSENAEPFQMETSDAFFLAVDGSPITVTFSGSYTNAMTAQSVVDAINSAWTGAGHGGVIAYLYPIGGQNHVQIKSQTSAGPSSTLQFYGNKTPLSKLGIPYGKVSGSNLCSKYGGSEIKFSHPMFDSSYAWTSLWLTLSNFSGTPLQKMGITAPITAYSSVREVPVTPPAWSSSDMPIVMLIPETLELGDIPNAESTTLQKFMNFDTVPQPIVTQDVANANKPVVLDKNGLIPSELINSNIPFLSLKLLTVGAGGSALAPKIDMSVDPTTLHNYQLITEALSAAPLYKASLRTYVGRDVDGPVFLQTWNAKWDGSHWNLDTTAGSPAFAMVWYNTVPRYELRRFTGPGTQWLPTAWTGSPSFQAYNGNVTVTGQFACVGAPFTFQDVNTGLSFTEVITSAPTQGANRIRVAEQDIIDRANSEGHEADWGMYSVFRDLNARTYISIGDGATTFGDFNGTTALQDAVNYLVTGGVKYATIYVKPGLYLATSTISVTGMDLKIFGAGQEVAGGVSIIYKPTTGNTITMTRSGNYGQLELRDLVITANTGFYGVEAAAGAQLHATNCYINHVCFRNPHSLSSGDYFQGSFKRCKLINVVAGKPVVSFLDVATAASPIVFDDCEFYNYAPTAQTVFVEAASGLSGVNHMDKLLFRNCRFDLATGTMSGGNLAVNTGLLDLHPNGNDVRAGNGLIIDNVAYEDCTVGFWAAGTTGSNVVMHLIPTPNGTNAVASGPFMYVDTLRFSDTSFAVKAKAATTVNAFTVTGARKVIVEDCKYAMDGTVTTGVQGVQTADCVYAFANTSVVESKWASIAISADDIYIKNFEGTGFFHRSGSGDMELWYNHVLKVDEALFHQYNTAPTAGGVPTGRISVYIGEHTSPYTGLSAYAQAELHGVKLSGATATQSGSWCLFTFLYLIAENIVVSKFMLTDFADLGVSYVTKEAIGVTYSSALSKYSDLVTIKDSRVIGRGLHVGVPDIRCLEIANNYFSDSDYTGVGVSIPYIRYHIDIHDNTIIGCESYGLYIVYDTMAGQINVHDNSIEYNDQTSGNLNQIYISATSTTDAEPVLSLYGNACFARDDASPSTSGYIKINRCVSSTLVALPTGDTTRNAGPYYGCETARGSTSTTFVYNSGQLMAHNLAYLRTP